MRNRKSEAPQSSLSTHLYQWWNPYEMNNSSLERTKSLNRNAEGYNELRNLKRTEQNDDSTPEQCYGLSQGFRNDRRSSAPVAIPHHFLQYCAAKRDVGSSSLKHDVKFSGNRDVSSAETTARVHGRGSESSSSSDSSSSSPDELLCTSTQEIQTGKTNSADSLNDCRRRRLLPPPEEEPTYPSVELGASSTTDVILSPLETRNPQLSLETPSSSSTLDRSSDLWLLLQQATTLKGNSQQLTHETNTPLILLSNASVTPTCRQKHELHQLLQILNSFFGLNINNANSTGSTNSTSSPSSSTPPSSSFISMTAQTSINNECTEHIYEGGIDSTSQAVDSQNNNGELPMTENNELLQTPRKEQNKKRSTTTLPTVLFDSRRKATLAPECKKCSICLDEFQHRDKQSFLPCFHTFHKHCIAKWLKRSSLCPICQLDIRKVLRLVRLRTTEVMSSKKSEQEQTIPSTTTDNNNNTHPLPHPNNETLDTHHHSQRTDILSRELLFSQENSFPENLLALRNLILLQQQQQQRNEATITGSTSERVTSTPILSTLSEQQNDVTSSTSVSQRISRRSESVNRIDNTPTIKADITTTTLLPPPSSFSTIFKSSNAGVTLSTDNHTDRRTARRHSHNVSSSFVNKNNNEFSMEQTPWVVSWQRPSSCRTVQFQSTALLSPANVTVSPPELSNSSKSRNIHRCVTSAATFETKGQQSSLQVISSDTGVKRATMTKTSEIAISSTSHVKSPPLLSSPSDFYPNDGISYSNNYKRSSIHYPITSSTLDNNKHRYELCCDNYKVCTSTQLLTPTQNYTFPNRRSFPISYSSTNVTDPVVAIAKNDHKSKQYSIRPPLPSAKKRHSTPTDQMATPMKLDKIKNKVTDKDTEQDIDDNNNNNNNNTKYQKSNKNGNNNSYDLPGHLLKPACNNRQETIANRRYSSQHDSSNINVLDKGLRNDACKQQMSSSASYDIVKPFHDSQSHYSSKFKFACIDIDHEQPQREDHFSSIDEKKRHTNNNSHLSNEFNTTSKLKNESDKTLTNNNHRSSQNKNDGNDVNKSHLKPRDNDECLTTSDNVKTSSSDATTTWQQQPSSLQSPESFNAHSSRDKEKQATTSSYKKSNNRINEVEKMDNRTNACQRCSAIYNTTYSTPPVPHEPKVLFQHTTKSAHHGTCNNEDTAGQHNKHTNNLLGESNHHDEYKISTETTSSKLTTTASSSKKKTSESLYCKVDAVDAGPIYKNDNPSVRTINTALTGNKTHNNKHESTASPSQRKRNSVVSNHSSHVKYHQPPPSSKHPLTLNESKTKTTETTKHNNSSAFVVNKKHNKYNFKAFNNYESQKMK